MVQSAEISPGPIQKTPQAQFVAALGARVAALQEAVSGLESEPHSVVRRSTLRRRLEAMAEAARVLGFDAAASAFCGAEQVLARSGERVATATISELRSTLAVVPSLIPDDIGPPKSEHTVLSALRAVTVVALGLVASQAKLKRAFSSAPHSSAHFTVELEDAMVLVDKYVPDLVLVDGRRLDLGPALDVLSAHSVCVVTDADTARTEELTRAGARLVFAPGESYEDVVVRTMESLDSAAPAEKVLSEPMDSADQGVREVLGAQARGTAARSPAGVRTRNARGSAEPTDLARRRVLVVDDDPAIAWFLGSVLRSAGATVIEANDGLEAWEVAQREIPDLVLSDMVMPKLDGFSLCRNLKRDAVLGDVPVVLLSCKDDLLQRGRELGVGADGYLPKEADAPEILERCAEALRARTRIEARLREEETVHGRLDGMTPRLVLELACDAVATARVVFHDAAFSYELYVGDGRLLSASRVSRDNLRESGDRVLPGLLGARAGRFEITRVGEGVQSQFCGSLASVLAPHIQRARAAARVVQGPALYEVSRIELDCDAAAAYRAASPAVVARLIDKLQQGHAPASLLRSVSPALLDAVLHDLAGRGAIVAALDSRGNDLLDAKQPSSWAQLIDVDVRTPTVGDSVLPAVGAPLVGKSSSADDVARAVAFTEQFQERLLESQRPPRVLSLPEAEESVPAPKSLFQSSSLKAIQQPAAEASQVASAQVESADLSDMVFGILSATPAVPRALGSRGAPEAVRSEAPVLQTLAQRLDASPRVRTGTPVLPPVAYDAPAPVEDNVQQVGARKSSESGAWGAQLRSSLARFGAFLTREPDSETPPIVLEQALPREPAVDSHQSERFERNERAEEVADDAGAQTCPPLRVTPRETAGARAAYAAEKLRGVASRVKTVPARLATMGAPLVLGVGAAGGAFMLVSVLTSGPQGAANSQPQARTQITEPEGAAATPGQVAEPGGSARSEPERLSQLAPPGDVRPSSSKAEPLVLANQEGELPAGVEVGPGKGLLEVDTGGKHRIYVGGVFVGRGPVRRVPLQAGTHSIETRLDGQVQTHEVAVLAGKRTRAAAARESGTAALK